MRRFASPRTLCLIATILVSSFVTQKAEAQRVTVDSLTLAPDQSGFSAFPSAWTPGHMRVDGTVWASYARRPLGQDLNRVVTHRLETTLAIQLGLGTRFALAARMPFLIHQNNGEVALIGGDTEAVYDPELGLVPIPSRYAIENRAIGNPGLDGRIRLLGEDLSDFIETPGRHGALALRGLVHFPLANPADAYYVDEQLRTELGAVVEIIGGGFGFAAYAGWRHRTGYTPLADNELSNTVTVSLGFKAPVRLLARATASTTLLIDEQLALEVRTGSAVSLGSTPSDSRPFEALASYRMQLSNLTFSLAGGGGLTESLGFAAARALAGMSIAL